MKRDHVYSKCVWCGWRQQTITTSGPVSFVEYYCQKCGDQLVICSDVRKATDRNKKVKTKKKEEKKRHQIGCSRFSAPENVVCSGNLVTHWYVGSIRISSQRCPNCRLDYVLSCHTWHLHILLASLYVRGVCTVDWPSCSPASLKEPAD